MADGAIWIWNLVEKYFPKAAQIIDWYHAVQYLTPIAAAAWGSDSQAAQDWLNKTSTLLWKGKIDKVIRACRHLLLNDLARDPAEKAVTYYTNNAHRMDYKRFFSRVFDWQRHHRKRLQANRNCALEAFWRTLDFSWRNPNCQSQGYLVEQYLG